MERRSDPWGDFLRRILLSASIAGTALPAAAAEEAPPIEVVEPDGAVPPPVTARPADPAAGG